MSALESLKEGAIECRCGCGRAYPLYSGLLSYGSASQVAFRMAHIEKEGLTKHLWLLLGSGPWFTGDTQGCWCVLDNWIADDSVIARVTDARDSPFTTETIFGERFLMRSEVLSTPGALEWAIARREDLVNGHAPTRTFLLGESFDA